MMIRGERRNVLLIPFLVMTISIVFLSIFGQYLIHRSLEELMGDVEHINLANNQKTLSHEIVQSIAADNLVGITQGKPIDYLFTSFEEGYEKILKGRAKYYSYSTAGEINKRYDSLELYYQSFIKLLELNINDTTNNNELFLNLLVAQGKFIYQINALVGSIYAASTNKIEKFEWREMGIMTGSIMVLTLEVIFIFLPAIKKLNKQNEYFKTIVYNQSHLVRHPLTSIQGLIFLMEESYNEEELKSFVPLLKEEVNKLDGVINATMVTALQDDDGFDNNTATNNMSKLK